MAGVTNESLSIHDLGEKMFVEELVAAIDSNITANVTSVLKR